MRWIGIDEAGYGPNLGPLVLAAVAAEGPADPPPALWTDLSRTVARAGTPGDRVWVDDSKAVYKGGKGLDRLEAAALSTIVASGRPLPENLGNLLESVSAGSFDEVELSPWLAPGENPPLPGPTSLARVRKSLALQPFSGAPWRIVAARAVVVGPHRFNRDIDATGSKSGAHFRAFARLLAPFWDEATVADGRETSVRSDKHGGRHFYLGPLSEAFPDLWIERGEEGPELSRYVLRDETRRLELSLVPRADGDDGLVALASILAKTLREHWMERFNAHFAGLIPGLRPTAGYPVDALRFRALIEPLCEARGLEPAFWWRSR